jgi:archaellum biogenesis ATPase FlaH
LKLVFGRDWAKNAAERFDEQTSEELKIPFASDTLNDITNNGILRGTLNIILAGVHVGKTMTMVSLAADYMKMGYDVFYVSMEMGENEILSRIDANVLKTPLHKISELGKEKFVTRITKIQEKFLGSIKVLQLPTSLGHTGHIENALNELRTKMHWTPSVVMVDYVGIVASSRIKVGSANSHFYLKSVAEELRAMAIKYNVAIWTAMQLTRTGMSATDVDMTDIAESIGIPGVADFTAALLRTEELDAVGQLVFKQLKNRYKNAGYRTRIKMGVDTDQQSLYDISDSEQDLDVEISSAGVSSADTQSKFESSFNGRSKKSNFSGIDFGDNSPPF